MDSKITLAFDREVIAKAKKFAKSQNISLSRLTEFLYAQITNGSYQSIENFPISDWVSRVAEGKGEYKLKSRRRKQLKDDFFNSRK